MRQPDFVGAPMSRSEIVGKPPASLDAYVNDVLHGKREVSAIKGFVGGAVSELANVAAILKAVVIAQGLEKETSDSAIGKLVVEFSRQLRERAADWETTAQRIVSESDETVTPS